MQSYFQIDLAAIKHNYRFYQSKFRQTHFRPNQSKGANFIAPVLKANAYGHGDIRVAQTLRSEGCEVLCVGRLDEALKLRDAGDRGDILYLGSFDSKDIASLRQLSQSGGFILTLSSPEQLAILPKGEKFRAHLNFDTGMTRLGFQVSAADNPLKRLLQWIEQIKLSSVVSVEGWMTHLHSAETPISSDQLEILTDILKPLLTEAVDSCPFHKSGVTEVQTQTVFQQLLQSKLEHPSLLQFGLIFIIDQLLRKIWPEGVVHVSNSAGAATLLESSHLTLQVFREMGLRPGLGIYGICPIKSEKSIELQPALSLHSKVMMVKTIHKGQGVSYGHSWKASRPTRIGVIPVGYGDGYPRLLSNTGQVYIKGQSCPIVGTVCMDYFMIDLGELSAEAAMGAEVLILGKSSEFENCEIAVPQVAEQAKTISWEILTRLTGRLPRVYKEAIKTR